MGIGLGGEDSGGGIIGGGGGGGSTSGGATSSTSTNAGAGGSGTGITFGGKPCILPNTIMDACRQQGLPTDWFGKPNSYRCPRGTQYGEAWLLMRKGDIDALKLDDLQTLVMADT